MTKHLLTYSTIFLATALLVLSCGRPSVPSHYSSESRQPRILPDYTEVTVPANICPLNFIVIEPGKEAIARITAGNVEYTYGEKKKIVIDEDEWKQLRQAARNGNMKVEVFVKEGNNWKAFQPFNIYVSEDTIDSYISYRLIQPLYVAFEDLTIAQRNLTTFEETEIYSNKSMNTPDQGQCINCHSYQNYHTERMMFHMRQRLGGTMIVDQGKLKKVDLKTDSTISTGVYPAWHPNLNLIAFSTNLTGQSFHTKHIGKVEVQDKESDLILYDVEKEEIYYVANDSNELEVFPTWSPDGNTLYYCSAHFEYNDPNNKEEEIISRYQELHYNIYAKSFNQKTRQFGERQLIFDAAADRKSATLPRISPDGKHMVFSLGDFGCFHVWHPEADIYLLNLNTHEIENLELLNSKRSESYPSFSSNGRWVMTASRRDDNNYTRPYISYFDKDGKCHKAFILPQRDPNFYTYFLHSYNRPEFMVEPIKITPERFITEAKKEAKKVKFIR